MNNDLDKKIKQDMRAQSKELDDLVNADLTIYLRQGFTNNFAWVMKVGYLLAFVFTALIAFCGYQFYVADANNEVFWGVCLILAFNAQVAVKLWIFMQTNRSILSREIRLIGQRALNERG